MIKALKKRIGETGEVLDAGIAWAERQAKQTADMDVPVLSGAAKLLQPAYVGARAVIAKATSGGGKYYQPEVRDERYFSNDELKEIAGNLDRNNGRHLTRDGYTGGMTGNLAAFSVGNALGGASVQNGAVTDVFDVNRRYKIIDEALGAAKTYAALGDEWKATAGKTAAHLFDLGNKALGKVVGSDADPDAGKVKTKIPLSALEKYRSIRQDSKGGDAGHMDPRELRQANGAGTPFKDRYEAMRNYERAVVKNLHPMVGPNGDNETAALFVNRSIERRNELFGEGIARYGARAMELVNRASAYVPPAPRADTPATGSGQGFIARAKEATGVIRDIAGLAVGGAKKSIDMDTIHAGAANLARPGGKSGIKEIDASLRSIPVVVNGKIDEGGRVRSMTDADRRDLRTFKSQIRYQQDSKGGDAGQGPEALMETSAGALAPQDGPRIVVNPSTFRNKKDALCVAFNERFRIAMEQYGFEPQSEPTDRQRRFFSDTAYADDELQLRRTIIARILTLDTSVKDPTDAQLAEAVSFLDRFRETESPSNDWEASAMDRLSVLVRTVAERGVRPAEGR